ncbi:hypothetical protein Q8F55_005319 [Vanrija albida]|uniref:Rhodanese domain-containing protein n=1 Tax=Vanrija albida TaxID=181172 RepID=A0ABR3Q1K0_9TREE
MLLLAPIVRGGLRRVHYRSLHARVSRVPLLLSPKELKGLDPKTIVALDASWHMPTSDRNGNDEFNAGPRLPGAQRFDIDAVAELRPEINPLSLTHMIPTVQVFQEAVEKFGITPDTHVVVYDTIGVFSSPRGAYTFKTFGHDKVSVLDGGLPRWIAEGGEVEVGDVAKPQTASYPAGEIDHESIRTYDQIVDNIAKGSAGEIILDARNIGRFSGEEPEPRPGLESGHIPGSGHLPFASLLTEATPERPYTSFKSPGELRDILVEAVGGEGAWKDVLAGKRGVVFSCGSGLTAGVDWLAAQLVAEAEGKTPKTAIYDESWTGYASRPQSVIEKGEPKPRK